MADETISTETIKKVSDGTVNITLEKYEELLAKAAEKAPVINKTVVKTAEMIAQEHRAWGWTFMGAGAALMVVGAIRVKLGHIES